jgi:hypothetical protein
LVGQPSFAGEHGVTAGACGVQPSDWLSDIGNVVNTIGKVASTAGQVGGALAPFLSFI